MCNRSFLGGNNPYHVIPVQAGTGMTYGCRVNNYHLFFDLIQS